MIRTLLAAATLALFTARAEAASPGACSTARTLADVGLVAAGVGTIGGALVIPGMTSDQRGLTLVGTGMTYVGISGALASGVAMVPTAARCGRAGRGVVGGLGLVMAGVGGPFAGLGLGIIAVGVAQNDPYGVIGVPLLAGGAAVATTGVLLNRRARTRLAPVQDLVVLPQLGQTPGLVVTGRF